jgi:hypothetical protein
MLPTKFRFIWLSVSEEKIVFKLANQKQELLVRPCFLMNWDEMSNLYGGPSIDASYQVSVHLAKGFHWRRLNCEKLMDDGQQTTDAK